VCKPPHLLQQCPVLLPQLLLDGLHVPAEDDMQQRLQAEISDEIAITSKVQETVPECLRLVSWRVMFMPSMHWTRNPAYFYPVPAGLVLNAVTCNEQVLHMLLDTDTVQYQY
jgi:hypothetical protein